MHMDLPVTYDGEETTTWQTSQGSVRFVVVDFCQNRYHLQSPNYRANCYLYIRSVGNEMVLFQGNGCSNQPSDFIERILLWGNMILQVFF